MLRKNIITALLVVSSVTGVLAQRTADFRRLSLENGNPAQKSWIISDQASLGIDESGNLTGTFPNTSALVTLMPTTKTSVLDLQSMAGGTGILFSQNQPLTGIDMSLGASGTGLIIDGATPLGISIGLISAGSDGMTVDATNSGISIGNGTAPSNGMNIEATSTGLAIGTATLPDVGQTTEANLIGGTFDAGIIGVDIGQVNSPLLGLGVQSNGTGIDVEDVAFVGTGINVTMNNFIGTGINIQDNTFGGTGLNVNAGFSSIGISISSFSSTGLTISGAATSISSTGGAMVLGASGATAVADGGAIPASAITVVVGSDGAVTAADAALPPVNEGQILYITTSDPDGVAITVGLNTVVIDDSEVGVFMCIGGQWRLAH